MHIFKLIPPILILATYAGVAADKPPRFQDYVAAPETLAHPHKVVIAGKRSREFASVLREAASGPPDFAGHYILASWGCGAGCIMAAAIDEKTGDVIWLPFTVCCWPLDVSEPLEFKIDSRLLIVRGSRNEKGKGIYYYLLQNQKFTLLAATEQNQ